MGFAISASAQDADKTFTLMTEAIDSIATHYVASKIRYALLTFGSTVSKEVTFTEDSPNPEELRKALEGVSRPSGAPDLKKALEEAKMMFKQATPRPGAKKVLIVIMDKKSASDASDVKEAAKLLEDVNVKVVPVAVGSEVSLSELEKTTTNKKFIVIVGNDEDPERLGEEIIRKALKSECFVSLKACNLP